jgi:hypothetical protein
VPIAVGWVVPKLAVLPEQPQDVDSKAVHATGEPEPHDLLDGLRHRGVVPVQIGLTAVAGVQVPLARRLRVLPRPVTEIALPVVRRRSIRCGVSPHVPVVARMIGAAPALEEPGMPIGGVIGDEIEHELDVPLVKCS